MDYDILIVIEYYNLIATSSVQDKFKINCPFHEDKDDSCYIDTHRNTFYCFGCDAKGDTVDFIKRIEDINMLQATMKYYKMLRGGNSNRRLINVRKSQPVDIKKALQEAKLYFYSLSKPSWKQIKRNYMLNRGFKIKTLIRHDIKINPDNSYQIICPIKDMGRFRGYVLRRTDGIDSNCKYLYNKGFRRNNILMGDYNLGGWIPVTEGYMDWLKLKQNNCENAVAIFGWQIKDKQILSIQSYTDTVISALDNTPTGEEGTRLLEEYFHVVRFQFPENCKDVGELSEIQFRKAWNDTLMKIKEYEKEYI